MQVKNTFNNPLIALVLIFCFNSWCYQNSASDHSSQVSRVLTSSDYMDYSQWKRFTDNYSKLTPAERDLSRFLKACSARIHDIVYEFSNQSTLDKPFEQLVTEIRNLEPAALRVLDLISYYVALHKSQWSKVVLIGTRLSQSSLIASLSLPNLEYFLYHLNRAAELIDQDLHLDLKFSTELWLPPSEPELRQANAKFFMTQTFPEQLNSRASIDLNSQFYDAYLSAIAQLSEFGLSSPENSQWTKLKARPNPRRRHLQDIATGLPPQLTLALLKIKRALHYAGSDFQSYNALLQLAYLSELAGRLDQQIEAIRKAASIHPTAPLYLKIAQFYKAEGDYAKMHEFNQLAINFNPNVTVVSGPTPELKSQTQTQSSVTLENELLRLIQTSLDDPKLPLKNLEKTSLKLPLLRNSTDFNEKLKQLLEMTIPRQNIDRWIQIWSLIYPHLNYSIQSRLQARILLWLQIMIYSRQTSPTDLSMQTKDNLAKIASQSILGSSIRRCLRSTSPSQLHGP